MASREPSPSASGVVRTEAEASRLGITPGPWRLQQTLGGLGYAIFGPEGSSLNPQHSARTVAEIRCQSRADGQAMVNAHWFAALPDLVAALHEIARLRTDLSGDFSMASRQSEIARAAIAKAERSASADVGRPVPPHGSGP